MAVNSMLSMIGNNRIVRQEDKGRLVGNNTKAGLWKTFRNLHTLGRNDSSQMCAAKTKKNKEANRLQKEDKILNAKKMEDFY